jgi:hypothetical protein
VALINWLYLAGASVLFLVSATVGWGDASLPTKAIVLSFTFVMAIVLRIGLAARLSFQTLLFARLIIWIIALIALSGVAISVLSTTLEPRIAGLIIFLLIIAATTASFIGMLAIGKPCPACDGRSLIQIVKGPYPSVGAGGFELKFFQSGVAQNCPQCGVDWSLTEREIREARANGGRVPRLDDVDQSTA